MTTVATTGDAEAAPVAVPNEDNAGFWEGCRRHQLRLQRCTRCGRYRHHPRPMCAHCNCLEYEWAKVSGRGTVFTFTIVHAPTLAAFQARIPYNVVVVQLEEGPFMVSNIVECSLDRLRIGLAVEATFEDVGDATSLPMFRPTGQNG